MFDVFWGNIFAIRIETNNNNGKIISFKFKPDPVL